MLEKLRAKSERAKRIISLGFTIAVFSGILFVWISSWGAQSQSEEIQSKAESPLASFSSMWDGLVMDVKDIISGAPSFTTNSATLATTTPSLAATSTDNFDVSGVVVIDPSEGTTTVTNPSSSLSK